MALLGESTQISPTFPGGSTVWSCWSTMHILMSVDRGFPEDTKGIVSVLSTEARCTMPVASSCALLTCSTRVLRLPETYIVCSASPYVLMMCSVRPAGRNASSNNANVDGLQRSPPLWTVCKLLRSSLARSSAVVLRTASSNAKLGPPVIVALYLEHS